MVDGTVIAIVRKYLAHVAQAGIAVEAGVLFGSCARGEQVAESDIDLLVVSPDFDKSIEHSQVDLLWGLRRFVDSRIEPHAVGSRQFNDDLTSPVIAIARKEGMVVPYVHSALITCGIARHFPLASCKNRSPLRERLLQRVTNVENVFLQEPILIGDEDELHHSGCRGRLSGTDKLSLILFGSDEFGVSVVLSEMNRTIKRLFSVTAAKSEGDR